MRKIQSKKAEGVFGISFGMIFSIILIVFFLAAAFIAIKAFLGWQKTAEIGLFFDKLQTDINYAWNSESASFNSSSTLPSGITYVCFVNLSSPSFNANTIEKQILNEVKKGYLDPTKNLYLYSPNKDYGINWRTITHVGSFSRNPLCIPVVNSVISVKIERSFSDKYPRIMN
jgi:hypothetical protein